MYRLRRYFRRTAGPQEGRPPVLMVHPDDVGEHVGRHPGGRRGRHLAQRRPGSVGDRLRRTRQVEGGMRRTLTDHVVALSEAIDTVKAVKPVG